MMPPFKIYTVLQNAFLLFTLFLTTQQTQAQSIKKNLEIIRIDTALTLDGVLDEPIYHAATPAKDFIQVSPNNGKPAIQPSEVWVFYDQSALYIGAMLYDSAPDSLCNFLTDRDNLGTSDYFGVYLDPFNEGQQAFGFFVTISGVQVDYKATKNTDGDWEDSNWNAVWESKTRTTDKGWSAEIRIPFSELRFEKKADNTWGLNLFRNSRRYNSNTSWNPIDRKTNGFIDQQGILSGIKNIDPPIRLSLSPYLSAYYRSGKETTDALLYKGGMDLKYGLNESFTLDMMLIPDFGQIQSDDNLLNLSPYELYYSEKRQFFTESTEMFTRGGIFYSRRIGAKPKFSDDVVTGDCDEISYNPSETQLANATKISGRTGKGWGLGFLNAMTLPSYAKITNTETGKTRKVLVQPLTNYNVSVVDKSLKNNSYISLINTNMYMPGHPLTANVTATEFQLRDKTRTYAISGKGGISIKNADTTLQTGYYGTLSLKKNKGDVQYGLDQIVYSDTYDPNDLGFLSYNNNLQTWPWIHLQKVEPFFVFCEVNSDIWLEYHRIYRPDVFSKKRACFDVNGKFKNNYYMDINGGYQTKADDYYEPRVKGRFYRYPRCCWYNLNLNTDWRKPVCFYLYYSHSNSFDSDQTSHSVSVTSRIRLTPSLQIGYSLYAYRSDHEAGYVNHNESNDSIRFAKRNIGILSNVLSASYVVNTKSSINFRTRHYWSGVQYQAYSLLQTDGTTTPDPSYTENNDKNYNTFTLDMIYRWEFAPGSELNLVWKKAVCSTEDVVDQNYWQNVQESWKNLDNSLSLKILYYINYNTVKQKRKA